MEHQMSHLFALPLYKASLNREYSAEERLFFQNELRDPILAISNYSSRNKNVLDAEAMQDIRKFLQSHLDNFFRITFNTANEVSLQITQSWLTRSLKGQSHHPHTHPNSIISGALYINLAARDGITFFRNEDNLWYELIRKEETYYNASRYFIATAVGDVVLFPSHIRHGVHAVSEDIERISLSFNTFFSGELGRKEFSNAVKISLG
ncbi:MAG: TIGR02466 family protein [Pseudomonadales bacterium]|nr:TIGR02466 family protein [Pseudomonadales bacterium]